MGQMVVVVAFWARHNKLISRVSSDPVGQPVRQDHEILNCFFIQPFVFQGKTHMNVAASVVISQQ